VSNECQSGKRNPTDRRDRGGKITIPEGIVGWGSHLKENDQKESRFKKKTKDTEIFFKKN